jgi:DNA modification methylase
MNRQMNLFADVLHAYSAERGFSIGNAELYDAVAVRAGIPDQAFAEKVPVGTAGQPHNLLARRIRWHQQTLKHAGIIERTGRGIWTLTEPASDELNKVRPSVAVLGFSTDLGIAILGACESVFARINEPIHLVVTSPPYPLAKARKYGNPTEPEYVDWICRTIEPVVKNLVPGGSICLNVSNDIFMPGSPARSLYRERLILALHDRLGLYKMDEIIWHNPSKAPAPVRWASMERVQLNVAWEPVYWLTNDPSKVRSDNRRVLLEHTERHMRLIAQGGTQRNASYADGAYNLRPGRFGNQTAGRIPRNLLMIGQAEKDQREYKRKARESGLPAHGATFPSRLAAFFIQFMTEPGDLVADPFAGSFTLPAEAERLGRRWIGTEQMMEYIAGAANRFTDAVGFRKAFEL